MGLISVTSDGWTADTSKKGFFRMTAHWMNTKGRKWELWEAIIGFKEMVGSHDGESLGRYMMGLLDRVGITSKNLTKVW